MYSTAYLTYMENVEMSRRKAFKFKLKVVQILVHLTVSLSDQLVLQSYLLLEVRKSQSIPCQ